MVGYISLEFKEKVMAGYKLCKEQCWALSQRQERRPAEAVATEAGGHKYAVLEAKRKILQEGGSRSTVSNAIEASR